MNKEFLASTSVFAEMANNKVDLKRIIDEFIISTFVLKKTYTQNSAEIKSSLAILFDLNIPEAIVRTQLKSLKRENIFEYVDGQYIINPEEKRTKSHINEDFYRKQSAHSELFAELVKFVEWKKGPLPKDQVQRLETTFIEYLFDNNIEDEHAAYVSAFIVKNEKKDKFLSELNLIREGATILKGIQYSSDFNDTSIWNDELTMYLDTEHLLSIIGLNGETYKIILEDFYELVRQINTLTREKHKKSLIHLKYTYPVKNEIEQLFHACKKIVDGKGTVKPGKTAIQSIIDGCETRTDVTRKESYFFSNLKNLNILLADELDLFERPEYNVVDERALEKYSDEKHEDEINEILESFTFINNLRKGRNNRSFEKIGHIILTGDRTTRMMSSDIDVKVENLDFSYATDIYYVTQKLWYKLNRGLGFTSKLPATLDIVNKAQIIISGQINNRVRKRYEILVDEIASGSRKEEEVKDYYLRLRANTFKPEEINEGNILEHVEFIYSKNDLEDYLRNESAKKSESLKRTETIERLKRETESKNKEIANLRKQRLLELQSHAEKSYRNLKALVAGIVVLFIIIILIFSFYLKEEKDTLIATLTFAVLILSTILIPFLNRKRILSLLRTKAYKKYEEGKKKYST